MSEIGERIRTLRQHLGLQQDELASRVRRYADGRAVAVETLSRIETGRNEPAAWMIRALAVAMETTSDYLLGLAEDPGIPDVPRFPVPSPEVIGIVARLNALPTELRKAASRVIEAVLDFGAHGAHSAQPYNERTQRWVWFLDQLSDEEYQQYLAEFEARHGHNGGADSQARRPAQKMAGSRSGE